MREENRSHAKAWKLYFTLYFTSNGLTGWVSICKEIRLCRTMELQSMVERIEIHIKCVIKIIQAWVIVFAVSFNG